MPGRVRGQRLARDPALGRVERNSLLRAEERVADAHLERAPGRRHGERHRRLLLGAPRSVDHLCQRPEQPLGQRGRAAAHAEGEDDDGLGRKLVVDAQVEAEVGELDAR